MSVSGIIGKSPNMLEKMVSYTTSDRGDAPNERQNNLLHYRHLEGGEPRTANNAISIQYP